MIFELGFVGFLFTGYAFMDTMAAITAGAMAERWRWNSFVSWGLFSGPVCSPLFRAWTWGGRWLSQLGNNV
jgi:Amt family ammonium transporter